ncbi:uncharacterized protein LOC130669675 [Microplitis mediator]|uniref:uncharacterized protein LOC130669675 n=1 Tax=Microplitis mediator TaxID=375433 RepID=UPI002556ED21|nr:uncharacterized protein LOC130669675 [Microplitis mediator]
MMNLNKYIILCLLYVCVVVCNKIKILGPLGSTDPPISHIHTRQLLELCFSEKMSHIAITSDLTDIMYQFKQDDLPISSFFIFDRIEIPSSKNFYFQQNYDQYISCQCYIFSVNSLYKLGSERARLYELYFWNTKNLVLIVGDQCSDAMKALKWLSEGQAIKSYFLCPDEFNNNTDIYMFNPYGDRAPKLWNKVETTDRPYDQWTVYKMPFVNDQSICSNLTYDKTEILDGYQLQVQGFEWMNFDKINLNEYDRSNTSDLYLKKTLLFYKNLFSAMNVTPIAYNENVTDYDVISVVDPRILEIVSSDLAFFSFYEQSGYVILTQKQSLIPTISQVAEEFFTYQNIVMSSIVLVILFIIILFNHKFHFGGAALDLLSFLLNMGLTTPINRLWMRITFLSATLFVIIFNPALQGLLTSILTRPEYRNVQTLKDLRDNNYHVYWSTIYEYNVILDSQLWDEDSLNKYVHVMYPGEQDYCTKNVRSKSTMACLIDFDSLEATDLDLHISKEFSHKIHGFIRPINWGLNEKAQKIAMKLFDSGFSDHVQKRNLYRILMKRKIKMDKIKALRDYEQLNLQDSALVYIAMTLVAAWAFLVLGVEILFKKIETFFKKRSQEAEMSKLEIRRRIASTVRKIAILSQEVIDV